MGFMRYSSLFNRLTARAGLFLAGAAAAAALAGALVAQYGFALHPCDLCLYQRYPYALIALVAFPAAIWVKRPGVQRALLLLCGLLFLADAGIAFYHTGVEFGWFKGPDACSATDAGEMTLEEMRAAIMNAPLVSCGQAMAYFFGLSMAAWNTIFAALMSALVLCVWRKKL